MTKTNSMINKALVINDDTISQMVTCKMISKAEFARETVSAYDGRQALTYFEDCLEDSSKASGLPEFIFLDLNMPVMNGWDFLDIFSKKFSNIFPHIKVAITSSYITDDELSRLRQYGAVLDYIPAPVDIGKLAEIKKKIGHFVHAA